MPTTNHSDPPGIAFFCAEPGSVYFFLFKTEFLQEDSDADLNFQRKSAILR